MNKSERFFRRYIFSIVSIIILFLFVNILLVASFFAAAYLGNVKNSNFPIEDFSNHITETNGQFNADIQAEDMLNNACAWAKRRGMIRHIGLTNHALSVAQDCIDSGLYETLQFPLSYLSGPQELALVEGCRQANMGYIAMKALAGGLIRDGVRVFTRRMKACFA